MIPLFHSFKELILAFLLPNLSYLTVRNLVLIKQIIFMYLFDPSMCKIYFLKSYTHTPGKKNEFTNSNIHFTYSTFYFFQSFIISSKFQFPKLLRLLIFFSTFSMLFKICHLFTLHSYHIMVDFLELMCSKIHSLWISVTFDIYRILLNIFVPQKNSTTPSITFCHSYLAKPSLHPWQALIFLQFSQTCLLKKII